MTVIDGVFGVEHTCDKQATDAFQLSRRQQWDYGRL